MKKKIEDKLERIKDNLEGGIEELGREENLQIDAFTYFKKRKVYQPEYVALFQDVANLFATNIKLSGGEYRILFYLISLVGYNNFIGIDIKSISENLEIHEKTIIKAISKFVEMNVVIKIPNLIDRRRHDYFINMEMFWKGSPEHRNKTIKKLKERNGLNILELPFKTT